MRTGTTNEPAGADDGALDRGAAETIVIEPPRGWVRLNLRELWQYRDLVRVLVQREVQGRYRQMALGPVWIVLVPLFNVVVFSLIFGGLAKLPSDGLPYPVFSYAAVLPWTFFATAVARGSASLVANMNLISKVYFPRMVVPIAAVGSGLVDFGASFVILLGMVFAYRIVPGWAVLALPVFLLLAACSALAACLWLAALAVRFRDVSLGLSYMIQAWMYLSPVVYPTSLIPARYRFYYQLNPMTTVLDGCRWALLGTRPPDLVPALFCLVLVILALFGGAFVFRRT